MPREEMLEQKRFPRWLVGLMVAFAALGGVACEANVDGEGGGEIEGEDNGGEGEGGVDADVDVDTDDQGGDDGDDE